MDQGSIDEIWEMKYYYFNFNFEKNSWDGEIRSQVSGRGLLWVGTLAG